MMLSQNAVKHLTKTPEGNRDKIGITINNLIIEIMVEI